MNKGTSIRKGSGNVFADLGMANPDEVLAKAELAKKISDIISARGLTQREAARILDIDQPKVSALMRGRLSGFSLERIFRFLNTLGKDVEIVVKEKADSSSEARTCVCNL